MIDNINDKHILFRKTSRCTVFTFTIGIFLQEAFQYSMTNKK